MREYSYQNEHDHIQMRQLILENHGIPQLSPYPTLGDLDLVSVSANGEIAAFCTVWIDSESRRGLFEPFGRGVFWKRLL